MLVIKVTWTINGLLPDDAYERFFEPKSVNNKNFKKRYSKINTF